VIHRRVAGIFATLVLIPQLMGAGDIACSGNARHDVAGAAAPVELMEGHRHHLPAGTNESPAPTERHQVADCCPAMSACSGIAIGATAAALTAGKQHGQAPTIVATLAVSRVESPDPPPPRV
jgi:hypothetical protein